MKIIQFERKPVQLLWQPSKRTKAAWRLLSRSSVVEFPALTPTRSTREFRFPLESFRDRFGRDDNSPLLRALNYYNQHGARDPYLCGDTHALAYRTYKGDMGLFNNPMPMPNFNCDPKGHLGYRVKSGGPDPFAWLDCKYGATKKVLREHWNKKLKISTRSDLIAHDDYICLLNPKLHTVYFHVFSDNYEINRRLEPGAPSLKRRQDAAEKLRRHGIRVIWVHDYAKGIPAEYNSIDEFKSLAAQRGMREFETNNLSVSARRNELIMRCLADVIRAEAYK